MTRKLILLLLAVTPLLWSADTKPSTTPEPLKIKVGDMAPDFTLMAFDGKEVKTVSLRDYRGKQNVAVAFFVFAFTPG